MMFLSERTNFGNFKRVTIERDLQEVILDEMVHRRVDIHCLNGLVIMLCDFGIEDLYSDRPTLLLERVDIPKDTLSINDPLMEFVRNANKWECTPKGYEMDLVKLPRLTEKRLSD